MLINYDIQNIRSVASVCESESNNISFSLNKAGGLNERFGGACDSFERLVEGACKGIVKDLVGQIVEKTEQCVEQKRLLLSATATFASEIAQSIEEQDRDISKKIGG